MQGTLSSVHKKSSSNKSELLIDNTQE
uniref:Uncharacterized protein n=1 Tax=Anguilla anguilla TaxID=7936 RepID=A0A0E9Q1K5_ANGAN